MNKEYLTFKQTAEYLGLSESYLYRLTSSQQIPFYRPMGKKIYFKINEVNKWIGRNKVDTLENNLKSKGIN